MAGYAEYLVKPAEEQALLDALHRALSGELRIEN
jgi:FixJ family two-component response regulator